MYLLLGAALAGFALGKVVRDVLSAVFLAGCTTAGLYWLATRAPEALESARFGRAVFQRFGWGGHVEASLPGLLLVAVAITLFSAATSRPPDRLKHWDDFGPRKRALRRAGRVPVFRSSDASRV